MAYLHKALADPDHDNTPIVNSSCCWDQHIQCRRGHNGEAKHPETKHTRNTMKYHDKISMDKSFVIPLNILFF